MTPISIPSAGRSQRRSPRRLKEHLKRLSGPCHEAYLHQLADSMRRMNQARRAKWACLRLDGDFHKLRSAIVERANACRPGSCETEVPRNFFRGSAPLAQVLGNSHDLRFKNGAGRLRTSLSVNAEKGRDKHINAHQDGQMARILLSSAGPTNLSPNSLPKPTPVCAEVETIHDRDVAGTMIEVLTRGWQNISTSLSRLQELSYKLLVYMKITIAELKLALCYIRTVAAQLETLIQNQAAHTGRHENTSYETILLLSIYSQTKDDPANLPRCSALGLR
ncbi:hypothetical protein AURDEDRAFT_131430 [Auricularia subglabra TFB-10046 SS5]|uniref:Uncharacterized protein n=1 Tax=Auricularia subglabra (strain TFB-10046 / SS5) TaxID=717982 RepID=J0LBW5_AURST|nr:hypothetical protein AURDEDRAFT_131430 [Auricularia subglabra TFB-10046 SS5]